MQLINALETNVHQDFDREVMESLKLVDAGIDGSVTYEMTITPNFSNLNSMKWRIKEVVCQS
jgi:acyl-coenzyme A thioesterase 13